MTLEDVVEFRRQHSDNDTYVMYAFQGASIYVFSGYDFVIWDDNHEVIHFIRVAVPGIPEYVKDRNQMVIKSIPYEFLVHISSNADKDKFEDKWLNGYFKNRNLISEKQIQILDGFAYAVQNAYSPIELSIDKYIDPANDLPKGEDAVTTALVDFGIVDEMIVD